VEEEGPAIGVPNAGEFLELTAITGGSEEAVG
jgi:hypothetical protein